MLCSDCFKLHSVNARDYFSVYAERNWIKKDGNRFRLYARSKEKSFSTNRVYLLTRFTTGFSTFIYNCILVTRGTAMRVKR